MASDEGVVGKGAKAARRLAGDDHVGELWPGGLGTLHDERDVRSAREVVLDPSDGALDVPEVDIAGAIRHIEPDVVAQRIALVVVVEFAGSLWHAGVRTG